MAENIREFCQQQLKAKGLARDFDRECLGFTVGMQTVANWKQSYFGAAYSTRLRQAIGDARALCDHMETVLNMVGASRIAPK